MCTRDSGVLNTVLKGCFLGFAHGRRYCTLHTCLFHVIMSIMDPLVDGHLRISSGSRMITWELFVFFRGGFFAKKYLYQNFFFGFTESSCEIVFILPLGLQTAM